MLLRKLAAAALLIALPQLAFAVDCSGNACDKVIVSKVSNCIVLRNRSDKEIRVQIGAYLYDLYAQSDLTPAPIGYPCWTSVDSIKADYE